MSRRVVEVGLIPPLQALDLIISFIHHKFLGKDQFSFFLKIDISDILIEEFVL